MQPQDILSETAEGTLFIPFFLEKGKKIRRSRNRIGFLE